VQHFYYGIRYSGWVPDPGATSLSARDWSLRRTALENCKTYATCPPHLLPEKRAAPDPLKCPVPGVAAPNIEGPERFSGRPRGTE
jgi:hypothetical protein